MKNKSDQFNDMKIGDTKGVGPLFSSMDPDLSITLKLRERTIDHLSFDATYHGIFLGEVFLEKDNWKTPWH